MSEIQLSGKVGKGALGVKLFSVAVLRCCSCAVKMVKILNGRKKILTAEEDFLDPEDYVTVNTVQTTRGCPFNCRVCSVKLFNGGTYRFRPIEDVVEKIKRLPSRNVFFVDDTILTRRERTK